MGGRYPPRSPIKLSFALYRRGSSANQDASEIRDTQSPGVHVQFTSDPGQRCILRVCHVRFRRESVKEYVGYQKESKVSGKSYECAR